MRDHSLEILDEAMRRGWDPGNLTPEQNRACAIAVRSRKELVEDAASLIACKTRHAIGLTVLPEKRAANEAKCRSNECGKLRKLVGGAIACDWCNCQAEDLAMKWEDPWSFCPGGYWSNLS